MPQLFCAVRIQLAQHELIQQGGLEQRLLVAEGFPDKDEGHDGLAARVEPEGVEGVQRLLGGLVEGEVEGEAAVVLPVALVGEHILGAVVVQTVEALVQRQVGAELGKPAGAVLTAPRTTARSRMENKAFMCALPMDLESSFSYCNTTRRKLCYNI